MRSQLQPFAAAILLAALASACATTRSPPAGPGLSRPMASAPASPVTPAVEARRVAPAAPPVEARPGVAAGATHPFGDLAGWAQEDHVAALEAFRQGCTISQDQALAEICARARARGLWDEPSARAFFEQNFRLEAPGDSGLLTAYFSPVYNARIRPEGEFTAAVRPAPADPPSLAVASPDRAQIEARPCPDALAWMRPEDLFFLQIQGSGVLVFPDGGRKRAVFDATNGAPFVGIARPLRDAGLLTGDNTSAEAIHAWLASNRGPRAAAIMNLDPRYVFFRLAPDDGAEPIGAAGARLIAGRSLAVDPSLHRFGELLWIDATAPVLSGAPPAYRRLAVALDAGGAIRGEARADLYLGRGPEAGLEAGKVRHSLRIYRLAPIDAPPS